MTDKESHMPKELTCALEGCEEKFVPKSSKNIYHSPACAKLAHNRKATPARSLDEVVADAERKDIERLNRQELRKVTSQEHRLRRYLDCLDGALRAYEPAELAHLGAPEGKPVHEDILITSDWHVGQKTTLEETGGMYEQDIATARMQVAKIWRAVERLYYINSSGRTTKKLNHLFIGDLVEGDDMRASQHRKIEDLVTVQLVEGFDLLAWLIRQELTLYDEVEVDVTGGNHDRMGKPGDAGLGELGYTDTFMWLAGAFLERVLQKDVESGRLTIKNWTTFFGFKEVLGLKVVFEHGSSFKWAAGGYGGIPWYAVSNLGPRYAAMLGGADLIAIGHGHRPVVLPNGRGWIIANGALPATSTYVQAGMKVVSRPQQWLLSVHEKMGLTNFTPIYADVPGTLLPGQIWEKPEHYAGMATGKSAPR